MKGHHTLDMFVIKERKLANLMMATQYILQSRAKDGIFKVELGVCSTW